MEQGVNEGHKPGLRFSILTWLIMGIVISNAYCGHNITDLSSPVKQVPVRYFDELISKIFTVYSQMEDIKGEREYNMTWIGI